MAIGNVLFFGPFRLDLHAQELRRDAEPICLRPKTWAVLRHFIERAGALVTKDELLEGVWAGTAVSEEVPGISVRELRRALGDDPGHPRFIETVHGRGYRFVAPVSSARERAPEHSTGSTTLVGRETEVQVLQMHLADALNGMRQILFVTGEGGIGKSSLVQAFADEVGNDVQVAFGQCVERHGAAEAFMPAVEEAVGRLARQPGGERLVAALRRFAPAWLLLLPGYTPESDREELRRNAGHITPDGMLRSLAEALETYSLESPVVLLLEDLHWSTAFEVDFLSRLALRTERARLLVIATYRPLEIALRGHPLRAAVERLHEQRRARDLELALLPATAVAVYVARRLSGAALPPRLATWVHERTDGSPLFFVTLVDQLIAQGIVQRADDGWRLVGDLTTVGVPHGLRRMIDAYIDALDPDQRQALEAGSATGMTFAAAAVAAGTGAAVLAVEDGCDALARRGQLIHPSEAVEWPDGTVSGGYTFEHSLYREILYERISPARRASLHQRLGERLERAYARATDEVAAELAHHFDRSGDGRRATSYHRVAAEHALARLAYPTAINHYAAALRQLEQLPASEERTHELIGLHVVHGAVMATEGFGDEVGAKYSTALQLARQVPESPQRAMILVGLCGYHAARGEPAVALEHGREAVDLGRRLDLPGPILAVAHATYGAALLLTGDMSPSRRHLEITLGLPTVQAGILQLGGAFAAVDHRLAAFSALAVALTLSGALDQAAAYHRDSLALGRAANEPFTRAWALVFGTLFHVIRVEGPEASALADEAIAFTTSRDITAWVGIATALRGHLRLSEERYDEAAADLTHGIERMRATGMRLMEPWHQAGLGLAHAKLGRYEQGLALVVDAEQRCEATGEGISLEGLLRIKASLLVQGSGTRGPGPIEMASAEDALGCSRAFAREHSALFWELRASLDLARLWIARRRHDEARALLDDVCGRFVEGLGSPCLRAAGALRASL